MKIFRSDEAKQEEFIERLIEAMDDYRVIIKLKEAAKKDGRDVLGSLGRDDSSDDMVLLRQQEREHRQLQKKLDELQSSSDLQLRSLSDDYRQKKEECAKLKEEVEFQVQEHRRKDLAWRRMKVQIEGVEARYKQLQQENEELTAKALDMRMSNERLTQENAALYSKNQEQEAEISKLKKMLADLGVSLNDKDISLTV